MHWRGGPVALAHIVSATSELVRTIKCLPIPDIRTNAQRVQKQKYFLFLIQPRIKWFYLSHYTLNKSLDFQWESLFKLNKFLP